MVRRGSSRLFVVAGLLGLLVHILPCALSRATPVSGDPAAASSGKRWVTFDLSSVDASGDLQVGKPVELSVALGGVAQGHAPLVAICESVHFQRQVVTLEQDPASFIMKGTVTLEPMPQGKLSIIPKVARVQVTFARLQKEKFERVLTRIVYVTLGKQDEAGENAPPAASDESSRADVSVEEEVQPDVEPVASGRMLEEDLLPLPSPGQGRAYWQQISLLVSKSWSRAARRVRHSPSSETVRVRFRLYPSGRAQLIQIEKGSGAREIDEAGIFAVVHAQPFPPFPDDVGTEPVDVHVRMRTGVKAGSQDTQTVVNPRAAGSQPGLGMPRK